MNDQKLLQDIANMRYYQKEYFKKRDASILKVAKKKEKEVDTILKIKGIEPDVNYTNQKSLFS